MWSARERHRDEGGLSDRGLVAAEKEEPAEQH
jgi:hypothetical protein